MTPNNAPTRTDNQSTTQSGVLPRPVIIDQVLERDPPTPPTHSEWLGEASPLMAVEEGEDSSAVRDDDKGCAG